LQAVVELAHQRLQRFGRGIVLRGARQAPGLHAHAAGLVDGGRTPFELPGDPDGEADRHQRHHEKRRANARELGGK